MKIFKVPELLAGKYHGAGHALAATVGGQLVDIVYLEDVLHDYDGNRPLSSLVGAINHPDLGLTVRKLQALGQVHVGMLSGWEFVEL